MPASVKLLRWSTTGMRSIPHGENAGRVDGPRLHAAGQSCREIARFTGNAQALMHEPILVALPPGRCKIPLM
jgi:hypothetical protein